MTGLGTDGYGLLASAAIAGRTFPGAGSPARGEIGGWLAAGDIRSLACAGWRAG